MVQRADLSYRPEIDGLRAIAILTVVGFHLGFSDWAGGFVGVDVFFVLSGYLICGQIYASLRAGDFSVLDFVARRIRRLSTAAFACFLVTGIAAWLVFLPFELPNFVRNLLGSITFTNNLLLMQEAGYFAPIASANPLLHTWSLAIEEQFYIFLPVFIIVLRRSARSFVWALGTLFVLSLALTMLSSELLHGQESRYFATDFRIWELALGGLVAVWLQHREPLRLPLLPLLALIATVSPVFLIKGSPLYPGPWALLVCLGTAVLLLSAHPSRSWTGRVLAMRVPRYLGQISYGTYLWHWPLIVFYQYVGGDLTDRTRAAFVLVSFTFGALSHHLIEMPTRRVSTDLHRKRLFIIFLVQTAILASLAFGLHLKSHNANPEDYAQLIRAPDGGAIANNRWNECWYRAGSLSSCSFGVEASDEHTTAPRPIILWGDSMANSALPAIDTLATQQGRTGRLMTSPSCAPLFAVSREQSSAEACIAMNEETLTQLETAQPSDVILFARWPYYAGGYSNDLNSPEGVVRFVDAELTTLPEDTFKVFANGIDMLLSAIPEHHRVFLIGPAPEMPHHVPLEMIKVLRFGGTVEPLTRAMYEARTRPTIGILEAIAKKHGVTFIDLTPDFCTDTECPQSHDGLPIIADQVHLSALGNEILLNRLKGKFEITQP